MPKFRLVYDVPSDTIPFPTAERWGSTEQESVDIDISDPVADAERIINRMQRQVDRLDSIIGEAPISFPGRFGRDDDGDDDGPRAA